MAEKEAKGKKNESFIDRMLKVVPEDQITQSKYLYILSLIVFLAMLGWSTVTWIQFFQSLGIRLFFQAIVMSVFCYLSLFSFKSARSAYKSIKSIYSINQTQNIEQKVESIGEMKDEFK